MLRVPRKPVRQIHLTPVDASGAALDLQPLPLGVEKFGRDGAPIAHTHDGQTVKQVVVLLEVIDHRYRA